MDRIALIGLGEETRGPKRLPSLLRAAIAIGVGLCVAENQRSLVAYRTGRSIYEC